ncbi:hypothetical protein [Mycobacterium sherrisii]|uniref:hypothetical protein n=1 Tax=Mycobacterium sherrisii TaxID=243061 RepID=UPI0012F49726|nr:hypothetical protein [Mycobacterium sherrisii]MCV7032349.1 hypothetical protein [Mycobacterium sherrisii]MEC4763569.1 hypothetical protein [Mycobacterium sherrisii]
MTGNVQPDAERAVKPSITATTILLLRRATVLPPFVQGFSVTREPIVLPETHVQYDAKQQDHEHFGKNPRKIFCRIHSAGTVSEASDKLAVCSKRMLLIINLSQYRFPGDQLAHTEMRRLMVVDRRW